MKKEMLLKNKHNTPEINDEGTFELYAIPGQHRGEVHLIWEPVPTAVCYLVEHRNCTDDNWIQMKLLGNNYYKINFLRENQTHEFRVAPVGINGAGGWSKTATIELKEFLINNTQ